MYHLQTISIFHINLLFNMTNKKKSILGVGSDFENNSGHIYVFHCYTKEEKLCDLDIKNNFENFVL